MTHCEHNFFPHKTLICTKLMHLCQICFVHTGPFVRIETSLSINLIYMYMHQAKNISQNTSVYNLPVPPLLVVLKHPEGE